jgi:hypothetical protein
MPLLTSLRDSYAAGVVVGKPHMSTHCHLHRVHQSVLRIY